MNIAGLAISTYRMRQEIRSRRRNNTGLSFQSVIDYPVFTASTAAEFADRGRPRFVDYAFRYDEALQPRMVESGYGYGNGEATGYRGSSHTSR